MVSLGIIAGLIVMVLWGVGNYVQAIPIRKIGSAKVLFFYHGINLLLFVPLTIILFYVNFLSLSVNSFLILAAVSFVNAIAVYNFMRSLEIGEVALSTPIASASTIITIILAFLFLNESLSMTQLIFIFIIMVGIILTSTDLRKIRHIRSAAGVKEALIAMVLFGVFFAGIGFVSKTEDFLSIFFVLRLCLGIFLMSLALYKKGIIRKSDLQIKHVFLQLITITILFNLGLLIFNFAVSLDLVSLVSPISSMNPAIAVVLALIFLKEKIVLNQKVGIITLLTGIFLLGIA